MHNEDDLPAMPDDSILSDGRIFKAYSEASRSLAELNGLLSGIPNSDIFIETVPLQEAKESCGIENILTSSDDLFRAMSAGEGSADADIRDVLNCRSAIDTAETGEITVEHIETVCSVLKGRPMTIRRTAEEQVYLKDGSGKTVRTPPSGDRVPEMLEDLLQYAKESNSDPILKMIVFHAVFETIHPFMDGNGRVGRILNEVLIRNYGLIDRPVLFLSGFLTANRRNYYRCLMKLQRDGSWNDYIEFMLTGITASSKRVKEQIISIRDLYHDTRSKCSSLGWCTDVLMNIIFSHVYAKIGFLVESGTASRNTASKYLRELEALGILRGEKCGREIIYLNIGLYNILSA